MAGLLLNIANQVQFFTDQGVVLAGGKIYTYTAGTSTPVATYTDSTLVTPNANPIILNSAGRLPNEIWIPAGTSVKLVFTDTSGNPIGPTFDNVPGMNDVAAQTIFWAGSSTGTANAVILSLTSGPSAYVNGQQFNFMASNTNTGAANVNVNNLGPIQITKNAGSPLVGGEIVTGQEYSLTYFNGAFNLDALAPLTAFRTDVASAATIDCSTVGARYVRVTGTTAISAITLANGTSVDILVGSSGLVFTSGANLILFGANLTCNAGDTLTFFGEASGVVRLTKYAPATGNNVGRLLRINYLTSSGNFSKGSDSSFIIVKAIGPGGGGGGAAQGASTASAATGGGGGAFTQKKYLTSALAASEPYVIGAIGNGGAAGANNGTAGTATTFSSAGNLITANGGGAGQTVAAGSVALISAVSGSGGSASGGDINVNGQNGGYSIMLSTTVLISGRGGDSGRAYGTGGAASLTSGNVGASYGSGGSGAAAAQSTSNQAGGNGGPGLIIIEEYA